MEQTKSIFKRVRQLCEVPNCFLEISEFCSIHFSFISQKLHHLHYKVFFIIGQLTRDIEEMIFI